MVLRILNGVVLFLSLTQASFGIFMQPRPIFCKQDPQEPECQEALKVREILPQLSENEQLIGVSTRNDRPNEIYAIIVVQNEFGHIQSVVFQKYLNKKGKIVPSNDSDDRVESSVAELNKGGSTIHSESGGFGLVTRKVLHIRAMAANETSGIDYDPTDFSAKDYEKAKEDPSKSKARLGAFDPKQGGKLWLSFAKDAADSADNVWKSGLGIHLLRQTIKSPDSDEEKHVWKLASDAEGLKPFDTIPLEVMKDSDDDAVGVNAKEVEQKLAKLLSGAQVIQTAQESTRERKPATSVSVADSPGSSGPSVSSSGG